MCNFMITKDRKCLLAKNKELCHIHEKKIMQNQLKNLGKQFDQLLQAGIPEEARVYLGMTGFKVIIDVHGELMKVVQPTAPAPDDPDGNDEGE